MKTFNRSILSTVAMLLCLHAPARAATLYVGNSDSNGNGYIESYNPPSGTGTQFASSGSYSAYSLAFDSAGNLYATVQASVGSPQIIKYTNTGGVLSSTGTTFTVCTGNYIPTGMAFDSAGNLYVANFNNTIEKYTSTGGVLSSNNTQFTSDVFNGPTGLAFDSVGNLYAANGNNSTIQEYTFTGGVLSSTGMQFANSSSGLSNPFGLAFDSVGNLYATNGNNTIEKFTSTGGVLSGTGTQFTSSGLSRPRGLAFDSADNLYVANQSSNTIVRYTSTGGVLSSTGTVFASGASSGVNTPFFLAFAPAQVPEPSSAVLLLAGLATAAMHRRRKGVAQHACRP